MRDKNLSRITEIVKAILPDSQITLFGSRERGDYETQSDYDILIVIQDDLDTGEKRHYASTIRRNLATANIDADVIVKTEADVVYYEDKIGSITREALLTGMSL